MENQKTKLAPKVLFLMGGSLFAMHFGGSSMIWPMTWGKESGTSLPLAFIGIFMTALLIPLLGYVALSRGKGTFLSISGRVSKRFGLIFCTITILVLGPLFCIPRMSAAAWDAFLQVSGFRPESFIAPLVFSIIYYLLTYWFIAQKSGVVDKLSKILFPVLVVAVVAIIVKGVLMPIGVQQPKTYTVNSFAYGFKNGYATAEVLCALVFGQIIIDDLKFKGIREDKIDISLIKIGIIGIGMLTFTHAGHAFVGSTAASLFPDLQYSALYSAVVLKLWGTVGGVIFNIALLFAALTTAIGFVVATANYFKEVSHDTISYNKAAIITLVVSAVISVVGLNTIVTFVAPLLDIVYPAAITLTLFYTFVKDFESKKKLFAGYKVGMIVAFVWGIFEGILAYMNMFKMDAGVLKTIHDAFPLTSSGLGWMPVTALAIIIGALLYKGSGTQTIVKNS
ncbi:branched-chain amino acid transport system II carrier protein [Clostridium peptidivorans]|uniref:branched-chain amino acid transport system II carrier protein n=1 Tax=Clostridium peptidivorans TaxID=100174 RepID=UPI000BE3768C|nr:branched-chain amino acid transport system II carrier protein [Clostridium peptidivorans]